MDVSKSGQSSRKNTTVETSRPPLISAAKINNGATRRSQTTEVSSSARSSSPSAVSRSMRSPSPSTNTKTANTTSFVLPKRSISAERKRPSTPATTVVQPSMLITGARLPDSVWLSTVSSLHVSFQSDKLSLPNKKPVGLSNVAHKLGEKTLPISQKPTSERKRVTDWCEDSKPVVGLRPSSTSVKVSSDSSSKSIDNDIDNTTSASNALHMAMNVRESDLPSLRSLDGSEGEEFEQNLVDNILLRIPNSDSPEKKSLSPSSVSSESPSPSVSSNPTSIRGIFPSKTRALNPASSRGMTKRITIDQLRNSKAVEGFHARLLDQRKWPSSTTLKVSSNSLTKSTDTTGDYSASVVSSDGSELEESSIDDISPRIPKIGYSSSCPTSPEKSSLLPSSACSASPSQMKASNPASFRGIYPLLTRNSIASGFTGVRKSGIIDQIENSGPTKGLHSQLLESHRWPSSTVLKVSSNSSTKKSNAIGHVDRDPDVLRRRMSFPEFGSMTPEKLGSHSASLVSFDESEEEKFEVCSFDDNSLRIPNNISSSSCLVSPDLSSLSPSSVSSVSPTRTRSMNPVSVKGIYPFQTSALNLAPATSSFQFGVSDFISTKGLSPAGLNASDRSSSRRVSPTPSRATRGVSPTPSRATRGVSPTPTKVSNTVSTKAVNPTLIRATRGVSPTPSRVSNTDSIRGISPTPTRTIRGVSPTPSRVLNVPSSRGVNPTPTKDTRGGSPTPSSVSNATSTKGLSQTPTSVSSVVSIRGANSTPTMATKGVSLSPTTAVEVISPNPTSVSSVVSIRGASSKPTMATRGDSPISTTSTRGVSLTPTSVSNVVSIKGANLTPIKPISEVSSTPITATRGVSPTPTTTSKGVSPTPTSVSSVVSIKGATPTPTMANRGISLTPTTVTTGVSPTPLRATRGVSPTPTIATRGVSPILTTATKGVSPTPTRVTRGVSPTPTTATTEIGPTPSRATIEVNPTPTSTNEVSQTPMRTTRGVTPTPTIANRGVSPTPTKATRGVSPTPAPATRGVSLTPIRATRGVSPTPATATRGASPAPSTASNTSSPKGVNLTTRALNLVSKRGVNPSRIRAPDPPTPRATRGISPTPFRPSSPTPFRPSSPSRESINSTSEFSFVVDVKKGNKDSNHIEDIHQLRLLDNIHLQWRYANARADKLLYKQKVAAERKLYSVWRTNSELLDSVTEKRINIKELKLKLKLYSILYNQIIYLKEWTIIEKNHTSILSQAIEDIQKATLSLPVIGGARGDIHSVKVAVCSAVDLMQRIELSICSILPRVEGVNTLLSELASVAAEERAFLDECEAIFSTTDVMQVEEYSLRAHLVQIKQARENDEH